MTIIETLFFLASALARHRGIALSTLGRELMGHGHFFLRLAEGRVTIGRADRALQVLSDHWPSDLGWPADIERPAPRAPTDRGEAA